MVSGIFTISELAVNKINTQCCFWPTMDHGSACGKLVTSLLDQKSLLVLMVVFHQTLLAYV